MYTYLGSKTSQPDMSSHGICFLRGAWNLEKLQRCPNQIFHRDGGSLSLDSTRSRVTVSSFNEYHIRAIFCGDIPLHGPYRGLIYGRYLE